MKTAVSVPNELFEEAEIVAKSMNVSRSQLYAKALAAFLAAQQPNDLAAQNGAAITRTLNEFYNATPAVIDEGFKRVALKRLKETEW